MNIKLLKKIRKQCQYRFCEGKLIVKFPSGRVEEYTDVNRFVENWCHSEIGWFTYSSHRERKEARVNERLWKEKWEKATNCSSQKVTE